MARAPRQDPKSQALARDGALNPHPEAVRDARFADNPFFDPKDLVQVRYEMIRRHKADGIPISDVAATFGVSRPTFYKAQDTLARPACRLAAPAARPQRRSQDLCRGRRLRRRSQSRHPRADDAAMPRRRRSALRHQGPSPQPGTRAGTQKKPLGPP